MAQKDIIQELSDLGSSLANATLQNIYSVPDGYFEGFASMIMSRIQAEEDGSVFLASLPKETPYEVPVGYFEGLEERMLVMIRNHADYQNSQEELESISPLLSSLNKKPVYSVPEEYFENLSIPFDGKISKKEESKVVSFTSRKWLRFAAAAVITGAIALAGIEIYNNNRKDGGEKIMAKVQKDVKKIDDIKQTQNLIDIMDGGMNEKELATVNKNNIKTDDVQQLLKDVSAEELNDFNEQSKDIQDVMMTN